MQAKMIHCRKCDARVSEFAERCPSCGDETAKRMGHASRGFNPVRAVAWLVLIGIALWLASQAGLK